ncbi:MAG: radical SAM family heme chaperone HemW [Proteobacteria bacterium]|nr:radical SAM family heme chaperone HemW [Candidatus Enterousia scatequi]
MDLAHNIYIHVPFCISKCKYCAFFSQASVAPDWDTYSKQIITEINHWADILNHCVVPTIFFGGGTPSLMPTNILDNIITATNKNFHILSNCEITLESNPGTLPGDKLNEFVSCGVNRLSVGVQSLNDKDLKFLGRRHDVKTALTLLDHALCKNINLNADFIYGLPGQTPADIIQLCHDINKIGLKHVSMYELTIEESTPFGKMNLDMPSNSVMADMYCAINDSLNLPRYEVSNYAAPGFECRHNLNIWNGGAYVGFGPTAAGRPFFNNHWHEQIGADTKCVELSDTDRAVEQLITGMRTIRGVEITDNIAKILNTDFIKNNSDLIKIDKNRIFATTQGMLVLDNLLLNMVK